MCDGAGRHTSTPPPLVVLRAQLPPARNRPYWEGDRTCPPIRAQDARQLPSFTTFSAAGPFSPWTTSNSTRSPSARLLKPSP